MSTHRPENRAEAMRILETEGLISVRRGNVGGAVVHLPTPDTYVLTFSRTGYGAQTTVIDLSAGQNHPGSPFTGAVATIRP